MRAWPTLQLNFYKIKHSVNTMLKKINDTKLVDMLLAKLGLKNTYIFCKRQKLKKLLRLIDYILPTNCHHWATVSRRSLLFKSYLKRLDHTVHLFGIPYLFDCKSRLKQFFIIIYAVYIQGRLTFSYHTYFYLLLFFQLAALV